MVYLVKMPKAAMGMSEGLVLEWLVEIGDVVDEGDPLLEIEAEKSTFEIAANECGTVREKYVGEGASAAPGTILGVVADPDEDLSDVRPETEGEADGDDELSDPQPTPESAADPDTTRDRERVRASPKARRRAEEVGVALADVDGSGPDGAVTVPDVENALTEVDATPYAAESTGTDGLSSVRATPRARRQARELNVNLDDIEGTGPKGAVTVCDLPPDGTSIGQRSQEGLPIKTAGPEPGDSTEHPLTGMRQAIADNLGRSSREAVHVTIHRDVPIPDAIEAATVVDEYIGQDATVIDVLLVAVSATLADHPSFNATFDGDTVTRYGSQHIGLAVDLDAGLVTPVLRDVESRSLAKVVAGRRQVTQAVVDGDYTVEELQGGTFTISNLGSLGVDSFTPIINPPQIAILGIDRIENRVVQADDGEIRAIPHLGLDVSFDHRVVDGADAARFLDTLSGYLQNPWPLLLERA